MLALGHTPLLPAAMLATWVAWEERDSCDCGSNAVAASPPPRSAPSALLRSARRSSEPKLKGVKSLPLRLDGGGRCLPPWSQIEMKRDVPFAMKSG